MILALTGATGFVGGRTLGFARAMGHEVRALTRRIQPRAEGVTWVRGALDDPAALATLVAGADAVIHVAGVLKGDRAALDAGNVAGTAAILGAARAGGVTRFVFVSSLAAREPGLSDYGASKRAAEDMVAASDRDWAIVRPPAVYGPGDKEMLDLFKAARRGLIPLPPKGRASLIHADDLAALLVALAVAPRLDRPLWEPDDGHGGYDHRAMGALIARAVGRPSLRLSLPAPLLHLGARIDERRRGGEARLTRDRARYFCHPDWASDPARAPDPAVWVPKIGAEAGLKATAGWYRAKGWL